MSGLNSVEGVDCRSLEGLPRRKGISWPSWNFSRLRMGWVLRLMLARACGGSTLSFKAHCWLANQSRLLGDACFKVFYSILGPWWKSSATKNYANLSKNDQLTLDPSSLENSLNYIAILVFITNIKGIACPHRPLIKMERVGKGRRKGKEGGQDKCLSFLSFLFFWG